MRFAKMHGAGNDYVYVNGFAEAVADPAALAQAVSNRQFGIGSDGLILILPSEVADVRMRMFNADGSEAEMCGNGIRCVAKYAYDHGLVTNKEIRVETGAGVKPLQLFTNAADKVERVRVNMGQPVLKRSRIPMAGPEAEQVVAESLAVLDRTFAITCVSMGNPHCVIFVDDVDAFPVELYGPAIENHPSFPRRINVEFVQVLSSGEVRQRTWERGAAETLACGTGACAAVVTGILRGLVKTPVRVHTRGGELEIAWAGPGAPVLMTGPAVTVFEGEMELD